MGWSFRGCGLPPPEFAVSVTEPPVQNVVGPPGVIEGVGGVGVTFTEIGAEDAWQPSGLWTATL